MVMRYETISDYKHYCGLLPTFTIERNAKFLLEITGNKDIVGFPHQRSWIP